jgi:hypothetical protein
MRHWNASSSRARSSHSTPPHRGQVYPLGIAFGSPAALGSLVWLNTSLAIVYLLPPRPQYRSHGTHVGRLHAFGARSEAAVYRAALLSQTFAQSGLGPEDIIALHCQSLAAILEGRLAREQVMVNGEALPLAPRGLICAGMTP